VDGRLIVTSEGGWGEDWVDSGSLEMTLTVGDCSTDFDSNVCCRAFLLIEYAADSFIECFFTLGISPPG
jgi:hypothetical protein